MNEKGKLFAGLVAVFLMPLVSLSARINTEEEIIIEMHGEPSVLEQTPTLWDHSTAKLTRKLRGKTREQVLYAIPIVSDKDYTVRGKNTEYALVEYDDAERFCKFLFQAEHPQYFIAAATTPEEVFALNKKHGINLGLSLKRFQSTYEGQYTEEYQNILPPGYQLFRLVADGKKKNLYAGFLFYNRNLAQVFYTQDEWQAYVQSLQAAAVKQPDKTSFPEKAAAAKPATRPAHKALLSGGTTQDQMYMPRVTKSVFIPEEQKSSNP